MITLSDGELLAWLVVVLATFAFVEYRRDH